ncbi:TetR/AcrR family transcriptional regulator [Marinicellulosiphila megalodicopiae]|uniref:TetR/AcrR family transcriptional regulator n=1 Tax=Marinicellulosiphila megalodicopiae TaxID=2724896 RepID=UPI003BAE3F29
MGRKISFNKQAALISCMNLFWQKGYDAISFRDLQSITALSGRSLIHSFGDKRAIFQLCVEQYLDYVEAILNEYSNLNNTHCIELFFKDFTTGKIEDNRKFGCFLLNSMKGTLENDTQFLEDFTQFKTRLNAFFTAQLKLIHIKDAKKKSEVFFSLLISGLIKISLYQDTKMMQSEYQSVCLLLNQWRLESDSTN